MCTTSEIDLFYKTFIIRWIINLTLKKEANLGTIHDSLTFYSLNINHLINKIIGRLISSKATQKFIIIIIINIITHRDKDK